MVVVFLGGWGGVGGASETPGASRQHGAAADGDGGGGGDFGEGKGPG